MENKYSIPMTIPLRYNLFRFVNLIWLLIIIFGVIPAFIDIFAGEFSGDNIEITLIWTVVFVKISTDIIFYNFLKKGSFTVNEEYVEIISPFQPEKIYWKHIDGVALGTFQLRNKIIFRQKNQKMSGIFFGNLPAINTILIKNCDKKLLLQTLQKYCDVKKEQLNADVTISSSPIQE